jgi:hypothetical protein
MSRESSFGMVGFKSSDENFGGEEEAEDQRFKQRRQDT